MNFNRFNNFKKLSESSSSQNSDDDKQGIDSKHSSPIIPSGLISKINSINNRATSNRMYAGYNNKVWRNTESIDYHELIRVLNEVTEGKETQSELFYSLHNIFTNKLNASFSALGLYNEQSKCINFKIVDKIGSTFSSRILINGSDTPVEKAFLSKTIQYSQNSNFLNVHYLNDSPVVIIPLCAQKDCIGVMIIGDSNYESSSEVYQLMSRYLALFIQNKDLQTRKSFTIQTNCQKCT